MFESHATAACWWADQVLNRDMALCYVPDQYRTKDLCEQAICRNPRDARHIPETFFKDTDFCARIVARQPDVIDSIPESSLTEPVCIAAVSANSEVLGKLPTGVITRNVCEQAIDCEEVRWSGEHGYDSILRFVPLRCMTEDLCRRAVKNWYQALSYVPENILTDDLCVLGLLQSPLAIAYIPPHRRTDVMRSLAHIKEYDGAFSLA